MIDTAKQVKIDSLNAKIEKCKQSIARLNDKLANIKSNIDNANKEIKSLNVMLVTEEKRNDYSLYLLKNLLVDIYNKYGKLTDSKYIELNRKGGLDGIFKCEKGNCKVTTVLAGGYNIQKLHFRTLIHDFNH